MLPLTSVPPPPVNTLEAALLKATQDLEHQIQARQLRRLEHGKSQLQLSAISGRWIQTQAGRRARKSKMSFLDRQIP